MKVRGADLVHLLSIGCLVLILRPILGMVTSVFYNDDRQVLVGSGSDYWDYLNCTDIQVNNECEVTVSDYVDAFYGGHFKRANVARNAIILGAILLVVRGSTFVALKKLTYTGK